MPGFAASLFGMAPFGAPGIGPSTVPARSPFLVVPSIDWVLFGGYSAPVAPTVARSPFLVVPSIDWVLFGTSSSSIAPSTGARSPFLVVPSIDWVLFGTSSVPVAPSSPLPDTFLAAIRATLMLDPGIKSQVPGGFWNRVVAPNRKYPFVQYLVDVATEERIGGRNFLQSGRLTMRVYTPDPERARSLSDEIIDRLVDDDADLMWRGGHITYLSTIGPASPAPPRAGYGGSLVTGEQRVFDYTLQGVHIQ